MTEIGGSIGAQREKLGARHLRGSGIEIGALDAPYPVDSRKIKVSYVDRFARQDLLNHYPELLGHADRIREPDIVDDGETLLTLPGESQDFIIASHFLEHCQNPLATLASHVRVLRPGGCILLAVPNTANRASWDHTRQRTSFEHLVRDDAEGPAVSREEHYVEWVTHAGKMSGEAARAEVRKLMAIDYSIHFHCWEAESFKEFIDRATTYKKLPVKVVEFTTNDYEIIAVIEKLTEGRNADLNFVDRLKTRLSRRAKELRR